MSKKTKVECLKCDKKYPSGLHDVRIIPVAFIQANYGSVSKFVEDERGCVFEADSYTVVKSDEYDETKYGPYLPDQDNSNSVTGENFNATMDGYVQYAADSAVKSLEKDGFTAKQIEKVVKALWAGMYQAKDMLTMEEARNYGSR